MSDTDRTSRPPSTMPPPPQTDEEAAIEGAITLIHKELSEVQGLATSVVAKLDGIRSAVAVIADDQQKIKARQGRAEDRLNALESIDAKRRIELLEREVERLRGTTILPPPPPGEHG